MIYLKKYEDFNPVEYVAPSGEHTSYKNDIKKKKRSTKKADIHCDITVAIAAPLTPILNTNINTGSSIIFAIVPINTVNIPAKEYPCAVMNGFRPALIIDAAVPIRYILIYGTAYPIVTSDAPNKNKSGQQNISPRTVIIRAVTSRSLKAVFIIFSAL